MTVSDKDCFSVHKFQLQQLCSVVNSVNTVFHLILITNRPFWTLQMPFFKCYFTKKKLTGILFLVASCSGLNYNMFRVVALTSLLF